MRTALATILAVAIVTIFGAAAFADDWVVVRLRGSVLQHVDGEWIKLKRGSVVPDSRVIRTLKTGNVEFERGNESVTIGPNTQIQIFDEESVKPFTTVKQYFGTVTVDAEVRQVQHFAVQTPYLAAVVKGTKFVVTSDDSGADVAVKRGHVLVEDKTSHDSVTLSIGQSATVGEDTPSMMIAGRGIGKPTPVENGDETPANGKGNSANAHSGKGDGNDNSGRGNRDGKNNGNGNGNGNNRGVGVGLEVAGVNAHVSLGGGNGNSGNNGNGNGNGNGGSLLDVGVGPVKLKL
jgi:hypothetical protein